MGSKTSKYGMGTIALRSDTWWIQYYRDGQRYRESSHSSERADAQNMLKRRLGEVATGQFGGLTPERVTVKQLLDLLYEDYYKRDRRSTYEMRKRCVKHLEPALGNVRAARLSSGQLQAYVEKRKSTKAANATINRELAYLRRALQLGAQQRPPLVLKAIFIAALPEDNVRQGFLEHSAYLRLRDELPLYLKPLFVVAYHVGARRGELTQIKWDQVDFDAALIVLRGKQTKNGSPRTLPIYGEMKHWFEMSKTEHDLKYPNCLWVFHEDGRRIQTFRKAWASACKRAKVPGLLFHDLRRSAVRNMERSGIPRTVAMAISGHKTEAVYRRYDIVSRKDIREAAIRMEQFIDAADARVKKEQEEEADANSHKDRHN